MRPALTVGCSLLLLLAPACRVDSDVRVPADPDVAVLAGRVGPGVPPDGEVPPRIDLVFTGEAGATVTTTARDGRYQVDLAPGTWSVRSTDGKACATGIVVTGGARHRNDLVYPAAECTDAAPPPAPAAPPAPEAPSG